MQMSDVCFRQNMIYQIRVFSAENITLADFSDACKHLVNIVWLEMKRDSSGMNVEET